MDMEKIGYAPQSSEIENALKLNAAGHGNEEVASRKEDLAASLEEIEKLDAVLKIKLSEEKKAKLSRIQTEEESRDVLNNLRSFKMPDIVKTNLEQFMKLLSEAMEKEEDCLSRLKPSDADGIGGEEKDGGEEGKEGKTSSKQQSLSVLTFVEKNIRLAKCGRGTLSLTDEEKSRIDNLLVDIEDPELEASAKATEPGAEIKEEFYAIDHQTKSILADIDQRLEALAKLKPPKGDRSEGQLSEKSGTDETGKQNRDKGRRKEGKKGSRLEEINKLLNCMNSASDQVIIPLPKEELESLVERSRQGLEEESVRESENGEERPNPKLPQEVVTELVSSAKFLMPNFKYRFDES